MFQKVIKFCRYTKKTPAQLIEEEKKDYLGRVPVLRAQLEGFTNVLKKV